MDENAIMLAEIARRDAVIRAELARRDPNDFIEYALRDETGRPLRQGAIHRELQAHFSRSERMIGAEFPRDHGKSVQLAVGGVAWMIGRHPNIRAKIICASDQLASARGAAVRRVIESEPFRAVFPEIKPGDKWGEARFTVQRNTNLVDPTLECFGLTSDATGGRADLIVFDDVVDIESVRSAAARRLVKERVENVWLNLRSPEGIAWWIATPWHQEDYTAEIRRGGRWAWLRRPVGPEYAPIWPERWNTEALLRRREEIGAVAYARGYLLEPVSDEDTVIRKEWIRYWFFPEEIPAGGVRVMGVDPAISTKTGADYSVIVEAVYAAPDLYVVGVHRGRWGAPALLENIRRRADEFRPSEIVVESVAYQRSIGENLLKIGPYPIRFAVPSGDPIGADKRQRAEWLAIHIENGKIRLRGQAGAGCVHAEQAALFDELTYFPAAEHDDALDALFYAARAAMKPRVQPRVVSVDEFLKELGA